MFNINTLTGEIYHSNNYLVVDFETTGLDKGSPLNEMNTLVLACWWFKGKYKHTFGSEFEMGDLLDDIAKADYIVAHNAKFELGWLKRCGAELRDIIVWDTMLADKVIAGNRAWTLSLNACLERRDLGEKDNLVNILIKGGVDCAHIPKDLLRRYCLVDVRQTRRLFKRQRLEMTRELLNVLLCRCLLTPVLADVEFNGMCLDPEDVNRIYHEESLNLAKAQQEFDKLAEGINPRSPKQMAEFLYDILGFEELKDYRGEPKRTDKGGRSVSEATIASLKAKTSSQKHFIEVFKNLKKVDTKVRKYLKKFKQACEETNGIIHAAFNQTTTETHRLSSTGGKSKVQLQNIDRGYKNLIKAREKGWLVGSADYRQLEFRAAVFLGQDSQGMEDIINNVDVHQFTADTLTNAGEPTDRQAAKKSTFKPLYGGSSGTPAEQKYYKAFREKYRDITNTQHSWIREVVATKKLKTVTGLTFYWPNVHVKSSGYVTEQEKICNYPVQSFATADIGPLGIVNLWHAMRGMESFLVNTVHDSIVAEVAPEEVDEFREKVKENMIAQVYNSLALLYNIKLNVALDVDINISERWK